MRVARFLPAACALLAAAGCGQKGSLYLPDKAAVVVTPSPDAAAGTAEPSQPATGTAPAAAPAPAKPTDKNENSPPK